MSKRKPRFKIKFDAGGMSIRLENGDKICIDAKQIKEIKWNK